MKYFFQKNNLNIFQFVVCTCFITFEKRRSLPPSRVRLLSERYEPIEDDSSDSNYEQIQTMNKGNFHTNTLLGWDLPVNRNNAMSHSIPSTHNGYGSVTRPH